MTHIFSVADQQLARSAGLEYRFSIDNPAHAPLAYLVHGRAGNYNLMGGFARVLPEHWNAIMPQAPFADLIGGYSWWPVDGEHAEVTQSSIQAGEVFEEFSQNIISRHELAPQFVVGIGFSQGGALLSIACQISAVQFKGLALLASFAVDSGIKRKNDLMNLKILSLHGRNDQVVSLSRLDKSLSIFERQGAVVERLVEDVAHKVGSQGMQRLKSWLAEF